MDANRVNFGYSSKNIPLPIEDQFKKTLINQSTKLVYRYRWKLHFFRNRNPNNNRKNNYGFKTANVPKPMQELERFEDDLAQLITDVNFRKNFTKKQSFQSKLAVDLKMVRRDNRVLIPADKTTNLYWQESEDYKKKVQDSITKNYSKVPISEQNRLDLKDRTLAEKLEIDDRVAMTPRAPAFVTFKDHDPNFNQSKKVRLINPNFNQSKKVRLINPNFNQSKKGQAY